MTVIFLNFSRTVASSDGMLKVTNNNWSQDLSELN